MEGNEVVYLTVLAPVTIKCCNINICKYQADIHIHGIDGCDIILAG